MDDLLDQSHMVDSEQSSFFPGNYHNFRARAFDASLRITQMARATRHERSSARALNFFFDTAPLFGVKPIERRARARF
jgi:hypothetical protein